MVPNLTKGRGIKGTALYVLHDERTLEDRALGADLTPDHQTQSRVGMTATRNLSTDDPELAWRLMCATAKNREALKAAAGVHKGGRQAKYEVGHLSLAWEHGNQPNRAEMLKAAEGALTALGWEKAQALIVEHRDHDHAHCHIVVNLIDPETGKALPNPKNDYDVLQKWAHAYEVESGKVVCHDRAEKIATEKQRQQQPEQPQQAKPERKKWLSRAEWEAQRAAANDTGPMPKKDRAEQQAARVDRYRDAAATVREQMRPEWAQLYKDQRQQARMLEKAQRATVRELDKAAQMQRVPTPTPYGKKAHGMGAARANQLTGFYNANSALIWEGVPADQRPQSVAAILNKPALQRAVDAAHAKQRAALDAAHEAAKKDLQARHDAARQEAQRAAWKQPAKAAPTQPPPERPADRAADAQRTANPNAQAQSDLDSSAERIRRRQRAPANESRDNAARAADPRPENRAQDSTTSRPDPRADDLAKWRAQADAEAAKLARIREARNRQRTRGRANGPEREPGLD